jgi:hypothetical protein
VYAAFFFSGNSKNSHTDWNPFTVVKRQPKLDVVRWSLAHCLVSLRLRLKKDFGKW